MRKKTKKACTTHIKLRWSSFETITRQISHEQPLHNDRDLIKAALELFNRERCEEAVRLVGFGVSKLYDEDAPVDYQPDLFADQDDLEEKNDQLDAAVDAIREQFGSDSLKRGN